MSAYKGVHFPLASLKTEVESLCVLAKDFLELESHPVLASWVADLTSVGNQPSTKALTWQISGDRPLRTKKTEGFEPNRRKVKQPVWGELTFTWQINRDSTDKKKPESRLLCLNGLASTRVKIFTDEAAGKALIAQWQVEVGSIDSPGWHFHVGLCSENDGGHFPKWLSVPRVPGLLVAPTDALDFLLGELFQDSWKQTVSSDIFQNVELGKAQNSRIQGMSTWHSLESKSGNGSAWNRLKLSKPGVGIFLP
jgi:hypothetical protein